MTLPSGAVVRRKLQQYLDSDTEFRAVFEYTRTRLHAAPDLFAHNWEHAYRDLVNALVIGEAEGADMAIALPAAIMHDIGYLYGGNAPTHGAIGADNLKHFLDEGKIKLPPDKFNHIRECIRTHKGNIHGEVPATLEAQVVSDADNLDKFGPVGVYQVTRSMAEFGQFAGKTITTLGRTDREPITKTGRALVDARRDFNLQFANALKTAYEPYLEESA
jgi:HD superfamily phosphodiesterase